jgi:hypothetical protein
MELKGRQVRLERKALMELLGPKARLESKVRPEPLDPRAIKVQPEPRGRLEPKGRLGRKVLMELPARLAQLGLQEDRRDQPVRRVRKGQLGLPVRQVPKAQQVRQVQQVRTVRQGQLVLKGREVRPGKWVRRQVP